MGPGFCLTYSRYQNQITMAVIELIACVVEGGDPLAHTHSWYTRYEQKAHACIHLRCILSIGVATVAKKRLFLTLMHIKKFCTTSDHAY